MFDPKLYREACRELAAPEDKLEEIIAMTENSNKKVRRPLRTALICAAAIAMMVVSAAAANPEGAAELWSHVLDIVHAGPYRTEIVTEDGETWTLLGLPESRLENRDGRAILVVNGRDAADITDGLTREGRFVFEKTDEDARLVITVTGSIDDWVLTTSLSDPDQEDPGMASVINSRDPGTKEFYEDGKHIFTYQSSDLSEESVNTGTYIVADGDLGGEVSIGFYTTESEIHQP